MTRAALALALVAGCACPPAIGPARFRNRPIAWRVDDRNDVTHAPASRPFAVKVYYIDSNIYTPVASSLELTAERHALDVNALDEVPDSSWFENRIGRREVSLEDVRRGPNQNEVDTSELTVTQTKAGGQSAGFIVRDARGERYLVKPDEAQAPVAESAADVAIQRLMWTVGYHVPENSIIHFTRKQLVLDTKAVVKDQFGNERPMTEADLDAILSRGHVAPNGKYRALASKYLPGKPLGGWPQAGVRPDDPNDRIAHEHLRVLRGLYLFYSWVTQTDIKEGNTLDAWVEDGGKHYVKHFLIDFGKGLGLLGSMSNQEGNGFRYDTDYEYILKSMFSFGLWRRPYDRTRKPAVPAVGLFDSEHYDPASWKGVARYEPFKFTDDRDLFWAAKIMARLTPAQIRVAVEQGRYEDQRSVDYLTDVLIARQRKAITWVFSKTSALDRFELGGKKLCFDDLLLTYKLQPGASALTQYAASAYDYAGRELAWKSDVLAANDGRTCVSELPKGEDHEGYAIIRVLTWRDDRALPPVEVHIASDPVTGVPRIIGIHRQ